MRRHLAALGLILGLVVTADVEAQKGVSLKSGAVIYCGSASNTTAPATIDEQKVREATPEWQTIQSEGVKKGSARYKLLSAEMDKRIREAVKTAAGEQSRDLVVRDGDVEDARGREVADITTQVIARLQTMPD